MTSCNWQNIKQNIKNDTEDLYSDKRRSIKVYWCGAKQQIATWTTYFDCRVIHLRGEIRLILRARLEANI